ncbi:MAG: molybdenum cofactor synthesis domain [Actinomycetia bacterium]|nr:molybdenum cofactor synthesis domain [Actinomycetes bacterium]
MGLVPLEEARAFVLERVAALDPAEVGLDEALHAVTAAEVLSSEAVPPFANSAMDGYALRAADTAGAPVELKVTGMIAAGTSPEGAVGPGEAMRIMTGAPMPDGADAVVLVERTRTEGAVVTIEITVEPGTSTRGVGEDVQPGDVVVAPGTVLTPGHLGVLASVGVDRVTVHRRPRVGVLSTGDELVTSGPLGRGQIRDSNRPTLVALVREAGFDAVDLGVVADDEASVTAAIEGAVASCDAVLTSGGVSMGDLDYVKVVLDRIGDMRWMQIAIKPAKPFAFGTVHSGGRHVPVFGLPGNPVSSMVSFELFARPALRKMAGHADLHRLTVDAVAPDGLRRSADGKVHLARVVATQEGAGWVVRSAGGQGSHQLSAMAAANALAVIPDGDGVEPGGTVPTMLLGWS